MPTKRSKIMKKNRHYVILALLAIILTTTIAGSCSEEKSVTKTKPKKDEVVTHNQAETGYDGVIVSDFSELYKARIKRNLALLEKYPPKYKTDEERKDFLAKEWKILMLKAQKDYWLDLKEIFYKNFASETKSDGTYFHDDIDYLTYYEDIKNIGQGVLIPSAIVKLKSKCTAADYISRSLRIIGIQYYRIKLENEYIKKQKKFVDVFKDAKTDLKAYWEALDEKVSKGSSSGLTRDVVEKATESWESFKKVDGLYRENNFEGCGGALPWWMIITPGAYEDLAPVLHLSEEKE